MSPEMRVENRNDPRCRGACRADRQSDRPTYDSPAEFIPGVVDEHGHRRLRCKCCGHVLSHVSSDPQAEAVAAAYRMTPDAQATGLVAWECRVCGYPVNVAREIRAKP